jgi:hypothetical protein
MKKFTITAIVALMLTAGAIAQTMSDKPATVVETMYLLPKRGMDDKMEAAIKAHDMKFHPEGQYQAGLRKVEYGDKAGWYVWVFGPTNYSAIDTRPKKEGGHDTDWSTNVDPLIDQYGATSLWEFNSDLSYGYDKLNKSNYYEIWAVKLKRGQRYRFKALAEKLKKTYETMGTSAFLIFDNSMHTTDGADLSIVWSFNTYAEWGKDSGTKAAFEKIYGDGSWQHMLDEWMDILNDYSSEIRSIVK